MSNEQNCDPVSMIRPEVGQVLVQVKPRTGLTGLTGQQMLVVEVHDHDGGRMAIVGRGEMWHWLPSGKPSAPGWHEGVNWFSTWPPPGFMLKEQS